MLILKSSFNGNKWIKNKHIETILPALFRKVNVHYERQRLGLADGDFIDIDWIKNNNDRLLLLFHGLEGSSQSQYIKGFAKHFSSQNFDICAVNFRSCSGENNRLITSYHSGKSDDIQTIIDHIISNNSYKNIVLGGFSLGGNVLLKYLGENGNKVPTLIKAAFAFSVPVDLAASSKTLSQTWNKVYMARFLKSLNRKLIEKSEKFPNQINIKGLEKITTFDDWDTRFTAKIHGFENAQHYYQECSSLQFLNEIKVPTLLVNAQNDPFLAPTCFPTEVAKNHPYFHLETPKFGGHVGFAIDNINGNYYSELIANQFIENNMTIN
ncbi:MAG: YheT family hydrolase [Candidatus Methylacidiphilales bacterium]